MKRAYDPIVDATVIRNILENEGEEYESNLHQPRDENNEIGEGSSAPKKKKRYSPIWKDFNIKLADDGKTEFAHCNYCTK